MPIEAVIREFVVESFLFGQAQSLPSDSTSFLEGGLLDSTGVLELVAFVEEKYGIKVEDDELAPENLDSVERVAKFIRAKQQKLAEAR